MRIGFDVSQTGSEKAGCGNYADSLIRALAQLDAENEYILYPTFGDVFWEPNKSSTIRISQPNFQHGPAQRSIEDMEQFWRKPLADLEQQLGNPEILHANNFFCPVGGSRQARIIYTLYDLAFIDYPDLTTEANRIACFDGVYRASLYADHIIAISEYSRQHFLRTFPHYPIDRITVVYPASRFTKRDDLARPAQLERVQPEQFFLSVGTLEPRKNHQRLLKAYARLKADRGIIPPLVFAGGKGWLMDDFERTVDRLGLRQDIILLGYVDDLVLQWLYQNCFAFIYPSLFEGFGLPILEAMSLGSAVVASNTTSIPEIVGEAGILINPLEEEEIYAALVNLTGPGSNRNYLKQQALTHASGFSWEKSALQVAAIYQVTKAQEPRSRAFTRVLPAALQSVSSSWERFGKEDPLWAVLTWPEKKGGKWQPEEFFDVGRQDVQALLTYLESLNVRVDKGVALDFGCGAGRLTQALAEHFEEVHGVDISSSMIETANRLNRYPTKCFFHLNKADDLQLFDDNSFDFILTLITLQHVPRRFALKYISEFVRILKPGGIVVFQAPDSRRGASGVPLPSILEETQESSPTSHTSMLMSGIPYAEVVNTLSSAGAHLIDVVEEQSAGQEWLSFRYCAVKQGAALATLP